MNFGIKLNRSDINRMNFYIGGGDNKTKMTFKLRKGGEDVAAYLATFGAVVAEEEAEPAESESTEGAAASE